jgi:hypothetical protein
MDTRVRHQVGLELGDIHVQGTIEAERGSQGGDDLGNQAVQVGVARALDVEVTLADVIGGLVVEDNGNISVLQKGVGGEDRVVGLNDGGRDTRGRVNSEAKLALLAIVNAETLEEEGAQTRSRATTDSVEDKESLKALASLSNTANAVKGSVNDVLADGVVASGIVVRSILLAADQLLGVEEGLVLASANFINDSGLQVNEDGTRNVLSRAGLREEGVEGIILLANGGVSGHGSIRLDAVLKAIKLPARVSDLDTSLSDVNRNDFTHVCRAREGGLRKEEA